MRARRRTCVGRLPLARGREGKEGSEKRQTEDDGRRHRCLFAAIASVAVHVQHERGGATRRVRRRHRDRIHDARALPRPLCCRNVRAAREALPACAAALRSLPGRVGVLSHPTACGRPHGNHAGNRQLRAGRRKGGSRGPAHSVLRGEVRWDFPWPHAAHVRATRVGLDVQRGLHNLLRHAHPALLGPRQRDAAPHRHDVLREWRGLVLLSHDGASLMG